MYIVVLYSRFDFPQLNYAFETVLHTLVLPPFLIYTFFRPFKLRVGPWWREILDGSGFVLLNDHVTLYTLKQSSYSLSFSLVLRRFAETRMLCKYWHEIPYLVYAVFLWVSLFVFYVVSLKYNLIFNRNLFTSQFQFQYIIIQPNS